MKVTINIPDQDILDTLETGSMRHSIGYWASECAFSGDLKEEHTVTEHNDSRDTSKHVTHVLDLERGVRMFIEGGYSYAHNTTGGEGPMHALDSNESDVFIQLCAFGEVRYG